MANPGCEVSHGVTVAFGTSVWTSELLDITHDGMTRAFVDTSHQATVSWRTFDHSGLTDPGTFTLTFHFDASNVPPVAGATAVESITITLPSGQSVVLTGGVSDFGYTAAHGDKFVGTCAFKITAAPDWNASS